MSRQLSFGRWTLRDQPMSKIALIGIVTSLIALIYFFSGRVPSWLNGSARLHLNGAGQIHSQQSDPTRYLGSIILSPRRGDKCKEIGLDNRNGAMWNKGYVECDVVPPLKDLEAQAKGLAARRLKAIGKAFSPKDDGE